MVFIECSTTGDLKGLVLEGQPAPAELVARWNDIHAEYCDLSGDGRLSTDMQKLRQAQVLAVKIQRISMMLGFLREMWMPQVVAELRIDYPMLALNAADEEQYAKDLDRIEALIKTDRVRLGNLQAEIGKEDKKSATREYFEDVVLEISKMQSYAVDIEKLTVMTYCRLVKRLNKYIEGINRQIEKTRGHGK